MVTGKVFQTINPSNGEVLSTYSYQTLTEVEEVLQKSFQSYQRNKSKPIDLRKLQVQKLAQSLRKNAAPLALLITREMGKAIVDSEAEIEKCAVTAEYFSQHLDAFLCDEKVEANYKKSIVIKNSLGPLLAIMPWNFPLWQVIRVLVPAIAVGNPVLLKHSDLTAGTASFLQKMCDEIEEGLLSHLLITHEQAAEVIAHPFVRAVTLTGSARAGREVAAVAGRHLKKTVLELGGSDAYIVLEDANIEKAARICAQGRMVNNGQSCVAAKRFIVHRSVLKEFMKLFSQELLNFPMGSPEDRSKKAGPLASKKFQNALLEQCQMLESLGAEKVFDADDKFNFQSADAFFPPRAYLIEKDISQAHSEELFGPVALIFSFETEEEALVLANKSIYGLGGAIFSEDRERAEKLARLMECGMVAINEQVKSDARMPFGGVKNSGYGRELSSYGVIEFSNVQSLGIS